jgi:hypothetical protein
LQQMHHHMNTHLDLFAYIRMQTPGNVPINVNLCFQLYVQSFNPNDICPTAHMCLLYIPSP